MQNELANPLSNAIDGIPASNSTSQQSNDDVTFPGSITHNAIMEAVLRGFPVKISFYRPLGRLMKDLQQSLPWAVAQQSLNTSRRSRTALTIPKLLTPTNEVGSPQAQSMAMTVVLKATYLIVAILTSDTTTTTQKT